MARCVRPGQRKQRPYPQEAIIGISYAVASAAVIVVMSQATARDRAPQRHARRQHPRGPWPEVWHDCGDVRGDRRFHYVFRRRFLEISIDPRRCRCGVPVRFWDSLFYASFGLVVTRSVAIAGVLLVFCYLIVPSVGAMLFSAVSARGWRSAGPWRHRVVSGMYFSVLLDLPTGATIVCTFGLVVVLMAVATDCNTSPGGRRL